MQPISLAITTFCRYDLTIKSFEKVIDDPRIDDIVILDDASPLNVGQQLADYFKENKKVRVIIQPVNRGMSKNKEMAIALALNSFVIILDSDNSIDSSYIDAIPNELNDNTIYMPEWSMPDFDFRKFSGHVVDRDNVKEFIADPMGNTCTNACNYLVNRDRYIEVYEEDNTVMESDTVNFFYLWMKAGYKFHIVKDMRYHHLVHSGSGWLQNAAYNMKKGEEIRNKIMQL